MFKWKKYNGAIIPDEAPHCSPTEEDLIEIEGKGLFVRYTTDFDCGFETGWWYVIKDTPFDISKLKSKRRYEINKGIKNFEVERISPKLHKDELCRIQIEAFSAYPAKYRPVVDVEEMKTRIDEWENDETVVYGGFDRNTNEMCGYAYLKKNGKCWEFNVLKTCPQAEKNGINAAMVNGILVDFEDKLRYGEYICDGSRNVLHETNFQDYLERYFEFRKAYCKLHIIYNKRIKSAIKILYPFRRILECFDFVRFVQKISAVLKMEEIVRRMNCG